MSCASGDTDWDAVDAAFDAVLDLPPDEREDFLHLEYADRPQLIARVLELLAAENDAGDFLEPEAPREEAGAPALSLPPGTRIGAWELVEAIGAGGMGEVYLARRADGQYQQLAALKLIAPGAAAQTERFLTERQILAALEHPNIARLLDGGLGGDGRPYMAMEYVDGEPLIEHCVQRDQSIDARIELFLGLCDAVAYAHQNLIVHRDIKPANVRVDGDGRPRLLDFGIALLLSDEAAGDNTQALATPSYAAPEQLAGGRITTATDIYGLGAVLYTLLTNAPPLELGGLSLPQLIDRLLNQVPLRASEQPGLAPRWRASIRGDLDAICARALAKDPARRYPSVHALAEDLRRHRAGLPVSARPDSWLYRARRYVRRNRYFVAAAAAVLLSLIGGLAGTAWQAHQAGIERDIARREAAQLSNLRTAVLQLFRSAAADADGEELSAARLFANSANKIDAEFRSDPATQGALLHMLGDLHLTMDDYAAARPLLERALEFGPETLDPTVRGRVHHSLAHIAVRDGDYELASTHYLSAKRIWDSDPDRYRAERVYAATIASQLARASGDSEAALTILERAAKDADAAWGRNHPETGIVLINLAVAHYYANRLDAALATCARAWSVWQAIGRTDSPDALNLLANWGVFALRSGDLIEGERRLAQALELRTTLYGASASQATLMKNLGYAHVLNGREEDGLALLEQAHWMAAEYAGAGGRLHLAAAHALGWALLRRGEATRAADVLDQALSQSGQRDNLWRHNVRALRATARHRLGLPGARELFDEAIAGLREAGSAGLPYLADALSDRALAAAAQDRAEDALADFDEALRVKRQARPGGHHEIQQIRVERAALLWASGRELEARRELEQATSQLTMRLGADHPLARAAAARADQLPSASAR